MTTQPHMIEFHELVDKTKPERGNKILLNVRDLVTVEEAEDANGVSRARIIAQHLKPLHSHESYQTIKNRLRAVGAVSPPANRERS